MAKNSFESQNCFEHIDKLSYEIGPRLASTERSQQASEYIKQQFESYGLETRFHNFDFVDKITQIKTRVIILIGVLLGAFFSNLYLGSLVSLLFVSSGYGLACFIPYLLPKKEDKNVVGILRPEDDIKKRIILGAHYDSARCTKGRKWTLFFRIAFPMILAAFLAFSICGVFLGMTGWIIGWSVLGAPYFFVCMSPFWFYEDLVSPGANDNASGVSIVLEVARVLSKSPLDNTEIRFIAFGAEEEGLKGSKDFSERTAAPDFFLNLDSLGSGDKLSVIQGNGVIRKRKTDQSLNKKMMEKSDLDIVWAPFSGHDHIPFLKKNMKATTLSSIEYQEKDRLDLFLEKFFSLSNVHIFRHSYLHSLEDVPEKISLGNIKKSGIAVLNLLDIEEDKT